MWQTKTGGKDVKTMRKAKGCVAKRKGNHFKSQKGQVGSFQTGGRALTQLVVKKVRGGAKGQRQSIAKVIATGNFWEKDTTRISAIAQLLLRRQSEKV